ncbi:MAG: glycosyltransferase [Actinomycetota bacterium]|nr:glycosyltransferase [Actinomycetota bacterium]
MSDALRIVICGLSVTSSWGNGHATNYRGLMRALSERGHDLLFLERDVPWYAARRDLPEPPWGRTRLYGSVRELHETQAEAVREADLVVVGSYVPEGVAVGEWVQRTARGICAFYDIDTPVTLAKLARGDHEYLAPELVPGYDLYLSFTGGPTLGRIERELGAPRAVAFHCLVDPAGHRPDPAAELRWDAGYLGTYSDDRQAALVALLVEPARRDPALRAVVAGPQYPPDLRWPPNVERIEHLPPARHRGFYTAQRVTVSVTRAAMRRAGWSPSVRLFEAAACATPILTDPWPGLQEFFVPGEEILIASTAEQAAGAMALPDERLRAIGDGARARVLAQHTAAHRAVELEEHVRAARTARLAA